MGLKKSLLAVAMAAGLAGDAMSDMGERITYRRKSTKSSKGSKTNYGSNFVKTIKHRRLRNRISRKSRQINRA